MAMTSRLSTRLLTRTLRKIRGVDRLQVGQPPEGNWVTGTWGGISILGKGVASAGQFFFYFEKRLAGPDGWLC